MKKQFLQTICFVVSLVMINTILFAQNRKAAEPFQKLESLEKFEMPSFEKTAPMKKTERTATAASGFRRDSSLCYRWDTLSNSWLVNSKSFYIYDTNGNQTSELSQTWNGTDWVNYWQYTSIYDTNGNQTSSLSQTWNGTAWLNSSQGIYTYDANRNWTNSLSQTWNGTAWVNSWQWSPTYDTSGNQISQLDQSWSGTAWRNEYQSTFTYDANGNRTSQLIQYWSGGTWVNDRQWTYTYDANGNRTSWLRQNWNGTDWLNDYQYTYAYDANGNRTSELEQNWNGTDWVNEYQYTYTYDANGNQTSSVLWYYSYPEYNDSCIYYWSGSTGIAEAAAGIGRVSVFPNPFTHSTTIEISNLQSAISNLQFVLYNVLGQQVHHQTLNSKQETLNLHLPSGIYFYKIKTEKESIANGKMVIQ